MTQDEALAVLAQIRVMLDVSDDSPEGSMGPAWIVRQIRDLLTLPEADSPRKRMLDAEARQDARQAAADERADARAVAMMAATVWASPPGREWDEHESLEFAQTILSLARGAQ